MPGWFNTIVYEVLRYPIWGGFTFGFSLRSQGTRHIPARGPALLVANHQSFFDPPAVGAVTPRHICFLARKTLFRGIFGKLISKLNAVPVDQDGVAKEGLRTVIDLLQRGEAVLLFPEGERTPDGSMLPFKPGILLVIKKTLAPIIPVGIAGAFEAFPRSVAIPKPAPLFMPASRGCMAIAVGRPLDPHRFLNQPRDQALRDLQAEIQTMKDQAERLRRKR